MFEEMVLFVATVRYSRVLSGNNLQDNDRLRILLLLWGLCFWHHSCTGSKTHPLAY